MPLWIWPAQGGAPRRVGEVMAYDARWFGPRQIIYANDGIYAVERDGSGSRLIAATEGRPSTFCWSPDGRRLRFTVDEDDYRTAAIWEMDADGKHLHRLFPGWGDPPHEENGVWLADASHYIFGESHGGSFDLWATQEKASFLRRRRASPVRLTAGPGGFNNPLATTGQRLLVFASNPKTELVRYDALSRQFATLFPNYHPWSTTYSKDGQWAAYVSPEGDLRKIKADGSEEVSLTVPPLETDTPAWSPNAKQVAFGGRRRDGRLLWKLYVSSADGGTPREIVPSEGEQAHPNWSPDGKLLAFDQKTISGTSDPVSIQVLNMETNQISMLPGSQGRAFASWSHDGHFVAALSEDQRKVMLFDLRTQSWSQVAAGNFIAGALSWSDDSKFLYFQDLLAPNEPVYRLHMHNRKIERVARFEVFLEAGVPRCGFQGLTADGALLVGLLRNHADIYALNLDLP